MSETSYPGLCVAVSQGRKADNQDDCRALPRANRNAVILADGLGGLRHGGPAAQQAVAFMSDQISLATQRLDYPAVFAAAKQRIITYARSKDHTGEEADHYATTLLLVEETADAIRVAYVGNGAIWHVRPQAIREPERQLLPWSVSNYLNPHSKDGGGSEQLYRLLSGNELASEAQPTVLDVAKDPVQGDIFVLCTDGIYSADQPLLGQNETGLWVRADAQALGLVRVLREVLTHPCPTNSLLQEALVSYLQSIEKQLDDDATIGVLVTSQALAFLSQPATVPADANSDN